MGYRKLGVFISLVAVISCFCITVLPTSNVSATTKVKVTVTQKSQIAVLENFGHLSNGAKPSYNQALATVIAYPSVPTMAEAKALGIADSSVNVATVSLTLQPSTTDKTSDNRIVTGKYTWVHGPSFAQGLGWVQKLRIIYNTKTNEVRHLSTRGYWFISTWASWGWNYTGEYSSDGYPYWCVGGGGKILRTVKYSFIETFGWGYGPISGSLLMRMYIIGAANGYITGGTF